MREPAAPCDKEPAAWPGAVSEQSEGSAPCSHWAGLESHWDGTTRAWSAVLPWRDPARATFVSAGEHNVESDDHTEQRRKVVRLLPHPTYNATVNEFHNDIALLELDQPLTFNSYVTPICLGSREFTNALLKQGVGTVSGWGKQLFRGRKANHPAGPQGALC